MPNNAQRMVYRPLLQFTEACLESFRDLETPQTDTNICEPAQEESADCLSIITTTLPQAGEASRKYGVKT